MSDLETQGSGNTSTQPDSTVVMPPVPPPGAPPSAREDPPRRTTPPWVWVLVGVLGATLIAGVLYAASSLGRRSGQVEQTAVEATSTEDAGAAADAAAEDEAGSGGGTTGGEAAPDGEVSPDDDTADGAAPPDDVGDPGDDATRDVVPVEPPTGTLIDYSTVLTAKGRDAYRSEHITLQPGRVRLTIRIARATGEPLSATYAYRGTISRSPEGSVGIGSRRWFDTPSATPGVSQATVDLSGAADWYFFVACDPAPWTFWSLKVEWRPQLSGS